MCPLPPTGVRAAAPPHHGQSHHRARRRSRRRDMHVESSAQPRLGDGAGGGSGLDSDGNPELDVSGEDGRSIVVGGDDDDPAACELKAGRALPWYTREQTGDEMIVCRTADVWREGRRPCKDRARARNWKSGAYNSAK